MYHRIHDQHHPGKYCIHAEGIKIKRSFAIVEIQLIFIAFLSLLVILLIIIIVGAI